jgi:DNA-binding IclR family transcriptional regulator
MTRHAGSGRPRGAEELRTSPAALRTVARVVEVLELVADRPPGLAISEIASLLEMPVSSAHALVRRLAELDYLRRRPSDRRYHAAPRLVRLGIRVAGGLEVMTVARPFISDLAVRTGEDVYLALVEDRGVIYADRATGSQSLRLEIALGTLRPLHATAVGKLYLAMLDEAELKTGLRRLKLERYTSNTLTEPAALARELRAIRRAGYALTNGEHIEGVSSVAAPIRDGAGAFVGALVLALPRRRFKERQDLLIRDVVAAAHHTSEQLGWQRPVDGQRGHRLLWAPVKGRAPEPRPAARKRRAGR